MQRLKRKLLACLLPVGLALALPLLFVCCSSQWLRDSSGFIYIANGRDVIWHDLQRNEGRRLTSGEQLQIVACLLPDGKGVAVARFQARQDETEIAVTTYDRNGVEKHASKPYRFKPQRDKKSEQLDVLMMQIRPSPDGNHFLILWPSASMAIVYNRSDRSFRTVEDLIPLSIETEANVWFDANPIAPDGSGFIALTENDDKSTALSLYPWAGGKPKTIEVKRTDEGATQESVGRVGTPFRWEDGLLVARFDRGRFALDPRKLTATSGPDERSAALLKHAAEYRVRVVYELSDGALLQVTEKDELQLWRPASDPPTTTLLTSLPGSCLVLCPSPNGRYVVAHSIGLEGGCKLIDVKNGRLEKVPPPAANSPNQ